MTLVWKLLRQHISIPQFAGFFLANLFGMVIVLLSYQFYSDVVPVFTSEDSFMKDDYIVVSRQIGMGNTISGRSSDFSGADIDDISSQPFSKKVASFTSTEYKVDARMGVNGQPILNTEMFFESIPDEFVDVPLDSWKYEVGQKEVPIVVPRSYINMYNFGFAQSHQLPKISDGLMGMIDFEITIHAGATTDQYKGRVIGFSNRLSSILVPQAFMDWSNSHYAPGKESRPSRLILQVNNPADENIGKYMEKHGLEMETDKLAAEKTTFFLRLVVTIVMIIGLIISALSFYILMLSIYLLVQKNSTKLENLLLIGYSPSRVAMPYGLLTLLLNVAVLILSIIIVAIARNYYIDMIYLLFPQLDSTSLLPSILLGLALFALVSVFNQLAIYMKIKRIWERKE